MAFRIDVTYVKPNDYREYALVNYPVGAKVTTKSPTLFIGAYCTSPADTQWLDDTVKAFVRQSKVDVKE